MAGDDTGQPENYTFTDLSGILASPDGPAAAGRVLGRLQHLRETVDARLAKGVAPSDYDRCRALAAALAAASRVMLLMAKPLSPGARGGGDS